MTYDFTGKTERDAIDAAAVQLGLEQDKFDVEILETQKASLFKKGYVKIRVHVDGAGSAADLEKEDAEAWQRAQRQFTSDAPSSRRREGGRGNRSHSSIATEFRDSVTAAPGVFTEPAPQDDFETKLVEFLIGMVTKMGYEGTAEFILREEKKLVIKLNSPNSNILIGRKGKNLDALQMLLNVYADRLERGEMRIILDAENYRIRHEEALVRLAYATADKIRSRGGSVLLEPMNPFERRIIHTALNDIDDIETKSEGDGLYKQVRVFGKGGYGSRGGRR
jgi:spoIIIJ-associated protein